MQQLVCPASEHCGELKCKRKRLSSWCSFAYSPGALDLIWFSTVLFCYVTNFKLNLYYKKPCFEYFAWKKYVSCIDIFYVKNALLICLFFSVHITELKNVVLGKKNASMLFQVPFKKLFQLAIKVSLRFQRTFQISWFEIKVNEVAPLCKAERKVLKAPGVSAAFPHHGFCLQLYFSPRKLVPLPQLNLTSECVPGHP